MVPKGQIIQGRPGHKFGHNYTPLSTSAIWEGQRPETIACDPTKQIPWGLTLRWVNSLKPKNTLMKVLFFFSILQVRSLVPGANFLSFPSQGVGKCSHDQPGIQDPDGDGAWRSGRDGRKASQSLWKLRTPG